MALHKWFHHFSRIRSSIFSEDMYRLHLILISVLSKSITVQLITTAATALLRGVIPPEQ